METDDGVGEPIRGMNCGETKEKAKATLALLGSPQGLSTCWNARVFFSSTMEIYWCLEKERMIDMRSLSG